MKRALLSLACLVSGLVLVVSGYGSFLALRVTSQVNVVDLRDEAATAASPSAATVARPTATPSSTRSSPAPVDQPLNVLLIGSDTRAGEVNSRYGDVASFGDPRADVTMVAHLSADRSWGFLMSVPRDLVVDIPTSKRACGSSGPDERTRFNESLSRGGVPCVVATLEGALPGMRVDHALVVDFEGFIGAVDALGGISVCLREPVQDSSASVDLPAGRQTLAGQEALGLVRARKSLADGSDIARTERQQLVAKALVEQLGVSRSMSSAVSLYDAAMKLAPFLTVDRDLASPWSLASLARDGVSAFDGSFSSRTLPWLSDPAAPQETVIVDTRGWEKLAKIFVDDVKPSRSNRNASRHSDPGEFFCN